MNTDRQNHKEEGKGNKFVCVTVEPSASVAEQVYLCSLEAFSGEH